MWDSPPIVSLKLNLVVEQIVFKRLGTDDKKILIRYNTEFEKQIFEGLSTVLSGNLH
jgi:hypothetical protein